MHNIASRITLQLGKDKFGEEEVKAAPKINVNIGVIIRKGKMNYIRLVEKDFSYTVCSVCCDLSERPSKKVNRTNIKLDKACVMKPGLNCDAKRKILNDKNLMPFSLNSPKTIQYGDTSLYSMHTDHPSWSPGVCVNLEKYEGRFIRRVSETTQQVFQFLILFI